MNVLETDISRYEYPLPNLNPPVIVTRYFTEEWCDHILAAAQASPSAPSGVHDNERKNGTEEQINSQYRSSSFCSVPNDIYKNVSEAIERCVNFLVLPHTPQYKSIKLSEGVGFLKYDASNSGHFSVHTDNAYWANGQFIYTYPHRVFSSVTYLNGDFNGGEFVLNTTMVNGQPLTIKPEKGLMVIFPSDTRFMHEVKPVTRGTRFSIVGWYNGQK